MIHTGTTDEQEALVALYVLGALERQEAEALRQHLEEGCAPCRRHAQTLSGVVADMALAAPASKPSPAVRTRLLATVAREAAAPTFAFSIAAEGEWAEIQPGVYRKPLSDGRAGDGSVSYLIRIKPGSTVARHDHGMTEHCMVLSGDLFIAGRHLHGGDYHYAARGSVHEPSRSDGGALLLIVEAS